MRNPFRYGGIVGGEAFCNRTEELATLSRAAENAERLFIYSERRMGKTSLVRAALDALPENRYHKIYVDLWPTSSELGFTTALARAISERLSTRADRLLETAKRLFGGLRPSITLDDQGHARITFQLQPSAPIGPELEQVLQAPAHLASQSKRRVVIVLDELQQILLYRSDLVERSLRSAIQAQPDVAYLFLGSRKHLIQQLFLAEARPLYRAGGHFPLGPIAELHWGPFIRDRFEAGQRRIGDDQIHTLCLLTEGHPFYTQHLCHAVWELTEQGAEVSDGVIREAVRLLLERESYAYGALWESLTLNQQRFLKGLALEMTDVQPYSAAFIQSHGLGTASNAQRAAEALLARDLIDRDEGTFLISDRFLRLWLQRLS